MLTRGMLFFSAGIGGMACCLLGAIIFAVCMRRSRQNLAAKLNETYQMPGKS